MFEINLVPDVKNKMIKALKIRNIVLFCCIVVSIASVGVVLLLLGIKGGQDLVMFNQDGRIDRMSKKINSFEHLDEYISVQNQLGQLSTISDNKQVLSRVFNILTATVPSGADSVSISRLSVDLGESALDIEGQANAGVEPLIDYRVLESFRKGIALTNYDYGRYVDEQGKEIPTYCITETDDSGKPLIKDDMYYALWDKNAKNCNPSEADTSEISWNEDGSAKVEEQKSDEKVEIYRTPKFNEWYKDNKMTLGGEISGVPHFVSQCLTYSGKETNNNDIKWTSNNSCLVAQDGMTVSESVNARDDSKNLVLRFSGKVQLNPDVLLFKNKHMMILGPVGQNVTDSYVQVEGMFGKRAVDCGKDDANCLDDAVNRFGENTTNSNSSQSGTNQKGSESGNTNSNAEDNPYRLNESTNGTKSNNGGNS